MLDARFICRHALFLESADGQHLAADTDLACHRDVGADRKSRQSGVQRGRHRHTRGGAVLGDRTLQGVEMDIVVLIEIGVELILLTAGADRGDRRLGALLHHIAE